MLTLHHLRRSQSERIIWLCEELGIEYALKCYDRAPLFAPPDYKALHPLGAAPVITDGDVVLAEFAAVVEYIIAKHGGGRLRRDQADADFVDYLYWFHFANGSLQPLLMRIMYVKRVNPPLDSPVLLGSLDRLDLALDLLDARLRDVDYLVGAELTAADIMAVFSLTTMRVFLPFDLAGHPNILAYLQRIGARSAYRRAMEKGDPGFEPVLS